MIKRVYLLIAVCLSCGMMKAQEQQKLFDEFLEVAGDQAEMYVGKMESGYPSTIYHNHPYWVFEDFLQGSVVYNGRLYRNVLLRYDTYLQQLVVKTPVKQSNVCPQMQFVDEFTMDGIKYSRRNGEFMAILVSSSRLELVEQVETRLREEIIGDSKVLSEFRRKLRYYVLRDGQMYEVDKLKSVLKLFPGVKKELKLFAKKNHLNFKSHRQSSLASVIKHADELMAQF